MYKERVYSRTAYRICRKGTVIVAVYYSCDNFHFDVCELNKVNPKSYTHQRVRYTNRIIFKENVTF